MTVIHVIGSLKGAMKAVDAGVDALVVEGVEGGGFKSALGASTLVLLPLVADRVDLPIIAAGGICDARSAAAAVILGAEGVQMGTRMLASHEAAVHANFKNGIIAAGDDGTVMLDLPGNPTMRVLRTGLAARAAAAEPGIQLLGRITDLYFEGDMEASVANTGQVSSRIIDLQPASQHRRANLGGDRKGPERQPFSAGSVSGEPLQQQVGQLVGLFVRYPVRNPAHDLEPVFAVHVASGVVGRFGHQGDVSVAPHVQRWHRDLLGDRARFGQRYRAIPVDRGCQGSGFEHGLCIALGHGGRLSCLPQ